MIAFQTEQEQFWAGNFGDEYIGRNQGSTLVAANISMFSKVLARTGRISSVLELGANVGMNLLALQQLVPGAELSGVEINKQAAAELNDNGFEAYTESILDFNPQRQWDLALIKGVLIHISPDHLNQVYDVLHRVGGRYVCIAEYYNPSPVAIPYRGHENKLFKRDFAGEMLDRFDDLNLVDYGFVYHRDKFPQDDITWFLLEKTPASRELDS